MAQAALNTPTSRATSVRLKKSVDIVQGIQTLPVPQWVGDSPSYLDFTRTEIATLTEAEKDEIHSSLQEK